MEWMHYVCEQQEPTDQKKHLSYFPFFKKSEKSHIDPLHVFVNVKHILKIQCMLPTKCMFHFSYALDCLALSSYAVQASDAEMMLIACFSYYCPE